MLELTGANGGIKLQNKIMLMEDAIGLIKDGDTIWVNAFAATASPVHLNKAITKRFRETGHPKNLSVYSAFSFSDWNENSDVEGYICEGAVDRTVIGFFGSLNRTCKAIMDNKIEGYNLPGGVMSHMLRAAASGQKQLLSKIGLNLYVDPRIHQYQLNERSKKELVHFDTLGGEEILIYDIPKIDVALIKASFADEKGNISFRNECASIDALSLAQATHTNGGKVIVQVVRVSTERIMPKLINIPAGLVDAIVVVPDQQQLTNVNGYFDFISGQYVPRGIVLKACREEMRQVIGTVTHRTDLHKAIAKRAFREIKKNQIVNIGIGLPEMVADEVLDHDMLEEVHLSVESGHTGGFPLGGQGFGVTIGADTMIDMARQFDLYEGGGLDICFIGALEIDKDGNGNGHYTKGKLSGIGGFANISQTTKKVVFCLTFSSKGLEGTFDGKEVHITKEGAIKKFVNEVSGLSFSVKNAYANHQEVMYVTERCVFRLLPDGLTITEIAPGVDLQQDILDQLPFEPKVAENLEYMCFD